MTTEFLPAAQAVVDAASKAFPSLQYHPGVQPIMAAALRAIAIEWQKEIDKAPATEFIRGIRNCIQSLEEIATELDGGKNG